MEAMNVEATSREREDAVLSIRDLRMNYDGRYVLNGVDLEARPKQIIGYIGPDGAGKSTTIKIMLGLVKGYTGEVRLFGQDIKDAGTEYRMDLANYPFCEHLNQLLQRNGKNGKPISNPNRIG